MKQITSPHKLYSILFLTFFLVLNIQQKSLHACALCTQEKEVAHVTIKTEIEDRIVSSIEIRYQFNEIFSRGLIPKYDKNNNAVIDKSEFEVISKLFYDYFERSGNFVRIKNYTSNTNSKASEAITLKYENSSLFFEDNLLVFTFTIKNEIPLEYNKTIDLLFMDYNFFFQFFIVDIVLHSNDVVYTINDNSAKINHKTSMVSHEENSKNSELKPGEVLNKALKFLNIAMNQQIHNSGNKPFNLFIFLLFSFLFGILHSLLPGHGKLILSGYVFSGNRNIPKIVFLCLAIPVVHISASLFLALLTKSMLKMIAVQVFNQYTVFMILFTSFALISTSIYLIFQQRKKHHHTCGCSSINKASTDIGIILAVGAIPCITTFSLLFYIVVQTSVIYAVFSGIMMSLGMSLVLFASAFFSRFIKNQIESRAKQLVPFFDYLSACILLFLGIYLALQLLL
jgi:nickel/cobalt exporter